MVLAENITKFGKDNMVVTNNYPADYKKAKMVFDAIIAERFGCPVVGNFRVRDVAAGGLGAPLVPYTEFLLYRSETEHTALQNIGGIGNITLLPAISAMSVPFRLPPPPTMSRAGRTAQKSEIAAAIVCAVKSVTVARMSAAPPRSAG